MIHGGTVRRALALAALAMLTAVVVTGRLRNGLSVPAPAAADVLSTAPARGVVISAEELPRDPSGGILVDRLEDVVPQRAVPEDSAVQRHALEAERDRLFSVSSDDAAPDTIPPLPDDEIGPARMDSGDPDPDRLQLESVPLELRSRR